MNKLFFVILFIGSFKSYGQKAKIMPIGTIVDYGSISSDTLRIGDSSYSYIGKNGYRWYVLTSTEEYPKGIWYPVGNVIKILDGHGDAMYDHKQRQKAKIKNSHQ